LLAGGFLLVGRSVLQFIPIVTLLLIAASMALLRASV
jgi:hypothetical protein